MTYHLCLCVAFVILEYQLLYFTVDNNLLVPTWLFCGRIDNLFCKSVNGNWFAGGNIAMHAWLWPFNNIVLQKLCENVGFGQTESNTEE